jgi:hypothetical protein
VRARYGATAVPPKAPRGTAAYYSGVATTAVRSFVSKTQTWIKVVRADIHRLEQAM